MRKSRFTPEQIAAILAEKAAGKSVKELAREHGIGEQTLYVWQRKFAGMDATETKRLKALEDENRRLQRIVASQAVDITILKDLLGKTW